MREPQVKAEKARARNPQYHKAKNRRRKERQREKKKARHAEVPADKAEVAEDVEEISGSEYAPSEGGKQVPLVAPPPA